MDEKTQYQILLNKLINTSNYINNAVSSLNSASYESNDAIVINGSAYKKDQIEQTSSRLNELNSNINNIYIPYVRGKIYEASQE